MISTLIFFEIIVLLLLHCLRESRSFQATIQRQLAVTSKVSNNLRTQLNSNSNINHKFQTHRSSYGYLNHKESGLNSYSENVINTSIKTKANLKKRWITGLSLGLIGTLWIASGNGLFTLGFLVFSLLSLSEYYSMVNAVGVEPATKTGIVALLLCYVTASMFPKYHEVVLPLSATFLMIWLLIFNKKSASISEMSTSLMGMFYIGYLPSFWIRLRSLDARSTLNFKIPQLLSKFELTQGSIITWWTWTSIVVADVSAYFIGKRFGKNKLSKISSAAGAASPNKTIEGAIGGIISCSIFCALGAYLMSWPIWPVSGGLYGIIISFVALVGDLTASMMKRDAGFKDSGNFFPGHGGLLDRFDSYMFTAPIAYIFCHRLLFIFQAIQK